LIGIDAGGTIRRSEFGMTYGDGWVGEEIRLVIGWRRSARSSGEAPLRRRRS
jgi:polyisoprenoid-binding protein YceI